MMKTNKERCLGYIAMHGMVSTPFLQRKMNISYKEANELKESCQVPDKFVPSLKKVDEAPERDLIGNYNWITMNGRDCDDDVEENA